MSLPIGPRGKTWPRPPRLSSHDFGSLSQAMGLSRTDPTFNKFTSGMRLLGAKFLNPTLLRRDQDRGQWTKFFNAALNMFPFVGMEYEGAWPIDGYMQRWLERMRWEQNRKKSHAAKSQQTERRPAEGGHCVDRQELPRKSSRNAEVRSPYQYQSRKVLSPVSNSRSSSESTRRSSTPVDLVSAPVQETQSTAMNAGRQSQILQATIPSSSSLASALPSTSSAQSVRMQQSTSSSISTKVRTAPGIQADKSSTPASKLSKFKLREGTIRLFLQSLSPSLEDLTQSFIDRGLVNKKCLLALAEMPDLEKDRFLRDDVLLTAFQSRVVRVGLANLLS
ncbi:uncharacterized protein C8Q71DRAFT_855264 [Rhodofomes roseus]|uniref:Uncharacterized protein n=1 Tax=Rhodofomes roseus TaxID=34475 RepID=A0ABQ8KQ23_9APHY|nr:uncharacterized protein C8Q71DRAFT_855264 [Rhodofomes roseus]KAH9839962.1 hypothetical protein C8Q71DRAFT_855264 [Rhodofomes roseus]